MPDPLSYLGAQEQADATKDAAKEAAESAKYGIDAQLQMWAKAQADFAPYLQAGQQGLATLLNNMPQYINNVLTPQAARLATYQTSGVINPLYGTVNPVTGEVYTPSNITIGMQQNGLIPTAPLNNYIPSNSSTGWNSNLSGIGWSSNLGSNLGGSLNNTLSNAVYGALPTTPQQSGTAQPTDYFRDVILKGIENWTMPDGSSGQPAGTQQTTTAPVIPQPSVSNTYPSTQQPAPNTYSAASTQPSTQNYTKASFLGGVGDTLKSVGGFVGGGLLTGDPILGGLLGGAITGGLSGSGSGGSSGTQATPTDKAAEYRALIDAYQTNNTPALNTKLPANVLTSGSKLTIPTGQIGATAEQLIQGGVLSPLVPTLPGEIDFQWNPEDPVYQYKLKQAEDAQKRYLSAIGGTDSSAALTKMRDTGLAVAAEDIDKQYAREQTERNYLAQKMMDEYNANAARGNTLYNRQYQAGQDAYSRANSALNQYDTDRLNNLMRAYDAYSNLYGLNYGSALDLSKIGAGQAGSAGQSSTATGQGMAQSYNDMGNTQANAIMANSQIWGNYMSGLSGQMSQLGNYFMNNYNPGTTGYSSYVTSPSAYSGSYYNSGYSQPITGGGVGDIGAWG